MPRALRSTMLVAGLVAGLGAVLLFGAHPLLAVAMLLGGAAPSLFKPT